MKQDPDINTSLRDFNESENVVDIIIDVAINTDDTILLKIAHWHQYVSLKDIRDRENSADIILCYGARILTPPPPTPPKLLGGSNTW